MDEQQQRWRAGNVKVSNMTPLPPLSFFLQVSCRWWKHDRQQWTNDTPTMNGWATSLPSLPFPFSYKNQGYVANGDFVDNSRHDNHEQQTMLRWAISFPSLLAFPFSYKNQRQRINQQRTNDDKEQQQTMTANTHNSKDNAEPWLCDGKQHFSHP